MAFRKYDIIIVGGGSGALLAKALADLHYRIAIVEQEAMGGTCLNRGCIPSKMLIHTAEIVMNLRRAHLFNLSVPSWHCNFKDLVQRVSKTVDQKSKRMTSFYQEHPLIDYFHKPAQFINSKVLQVGKDQLTAKKFFLSVGARPLIPQIPGLNETPFLTSKEALRLEKQPNHLVIIGGGYIAAELGFFYASLGTKVTLLVRKKNMLTREDISIQKEFPKLFGSYCNILFGAEVSFVSYAKKQFSIEYQEEKKNKKLKADALLVATGLTPWTDHLGLENTAIETDDKGFILVNKTLRTKEKHIWAFGDCIGEPFYRHSANFEAEYLLETLFKKKRSFPIDYTLMPHAIFSYPQVASVGKTEQQLKKERIPYFIGKSEYQKSARGLALLPEGGFVKLLFSQQNEELLGAHILGEDAATLCHILISFLKYKAKLKDIKEMIYIHPSLPEVVRDAAKFLMNKDKNNWNENEKSHD